jgi:hypothetical protein
MFAVLARAWRAHGRLMQSLNGLACPRRFQTPAAPIRECKAVGCGEVTSAVDTEWSDFHSLKTSQLLVMTTLEARWARGKLERRSPRASRVFGRLLFQI